MEDIKLYRPSYSEFVEYAGRVSESILNDGFVPDVLVAVLRGGAGVSRMFSDMLCECPITTLECKAYADVGMVGEPVIVQDIAVDIHEKDVLVVDDICDTGKSLERCYNHLLEKNPRSIRVATIYRRNTSCFVPDYYAADAGKYWIVFPGEESETIRKLIRRHKRKALESVFTDDEIHNTLRRWWVYKEASLY